MASVRDLVPLSRSALARVAAEIDTHHVCDEGYSQFIFRHMLDFLQHHKGTWEEKDLFLLGGLYRFAPSAYRADKPQMETLYGSDVMTLIPDIDDNRDKREDAPISERSNILEILEVVVAMRTGGLLMRDRVEKMSPEKRREGRITAKQYLEARPALVSAPELETALRKEIDHWLDVIEKTPYTEPEAGKKTAIRDIVLAAKPAGTYRPAWLRPKRGWRG